MPPKAKRNNKTTQKINSNGKGKAATAGRTLTTKVTFANSGPSKIRETFAPISEGTTLGSSSLMMTGKAQYLTEQSGMGDSIRVTGSDLITAPINTNGASTTGAFNGSSGITLGPAEISSRLQNFQLMFQYYAYRRLRIHYVPMCSTSTGGSLALAVVSNSSTFLGGLPTGQPQVLQYDPSGLTQVWSRMTLDYNFTGTKLWSTSTLNQATDYDDYVQVCLAGILAGGALSTAYGNLWIEYVIDFYKPSQILTSPSLTGQISKLSASDQQTLLTEVKKRNESKKEDRNKEEEEKNGSSEPKHSAWSLFK